MNNDFETNSLLPQPISFSSITDNAIIQPELPPTPPPDTPSGEVYTEPAIDMKVTRTMTADAVSIIDKSSLQIILIMLLLKFYFSIF